MELILKSFSLHLLLYCASQALDVDIESQPVVGAEGSIWTELDQTVSLTCVTLAENEVEWRRNGALVQLHEGNSKGRSSLCVSPVSREDDDATFSCQLRQDASVNASVTLNVTYAPMLSGTENVTVEEDAELSLSCEIRANPPVSASWQQEGDLLDLSTRGFMVTNDGFTTQLSVRRVKRDWHQGSYECVTVSAIYGTRSRLFHVQVTDKTIKFPLMPIIAGGVVVCLTALLAVVSRWSRVVKCCK